MGNPSSKLIWFAIPIVVFLSMLTLFITRLPKSQSLSTSVPPSPSSTPTSPLVLPQSPPSSPVDQINQFQLQDPRYTPPNFDRKISLPTE